MKVNKAVPLGAPDLTALPVRALLGHSRERRIALSKSFTSLASGVHALEAALDDASTRLVEAAEEYGMVHPPSMKVQRKRGTQRMKHIRKLLDLADNLNQEVRGRLRVAKKVATDVLVLAPVLASAAAGLKPFSASGAGCEYKDGEEEGEAHAAKASLEYGELMEEYAAVSATIEDNAEARLQSFDRQNTNRSFVDGVHRSAVLPLRAEDHHSLPILAHRVEVATGVARDLAVDVTTLESSIVAETAETSSYASAKSTIISTWGRAKSALKVPQKGSSSHTTTNKSKLLTSERAPPPPPPPPAAHAAHAATDTAAHRCRTASTRNKKMADAHANPLKGSPGVLVGSTAHYGWALPPSAYDPWHNQHSSTRSHRTRAGISSASLTRPHAAAAASSQCVNRKSNQSANNKAPLHSGGSRARQASGAIGRASVAARVAEQPLGFNSSTGPHDASFPLPLTAYCSFLAKSVFGKSIQGRSTPFDPATGRFLATVDWSDLCNRIDEAETPASPSIDLSSLPDSPDPLPASSPSSYSSSPLQPQPPPAHVPVQHVDDASLNTAHNGIFLEASAMAVGTGAVNVDADVKDKAMGSARKKGKEARKVLRCIECQQFGWGCQKHSSVRNPKPFFYDSCVSSTIAQVPSACSGSSDGRRSLMYRDQCAWSQEMKRAVQNKPSAFSMTSTDRLIRPGGAIDDSQLKATEFRLDHLKRLDEFKAAGDVRRSTQALRDAQRRSMETRHAAASGASAAETLRRRFQ